MFSLGANVFRAFFYSTPKMMRPPLQNPRLAFLFNIIFLALTLIGSSYAEPLKPDWVLRAQITRADHQSYKEIPFEVPPGIERLSFETQYTQRDQKTVIDFGLVDPLGKIVGWSGGNKSQFTVSSVDATPSYTPRVIQQGMWKILLGIPNNREGVTAEVEVRVYFSQSLSGANTPSWVHPVLNPKKAWYRGDLHAHSAHSDGSCKSMSQSKDVPCPAFLIAEKAKSLHLDFLALSEHNTVSQAQVIRELQPYYDALLMLPSREITSFYGHANLLGTFDSFDFRLTHKKSTWMEEMKRLKDRSEDTFLSINHPNFPSGELCMGCGWELDTDFLDHQVVDGVEVANGDDAGTIYSGLSYWLKLLDKGYRLTAVAGSDNHRVDQAENVRSSLGRPTNVVYAQALSTQEITRALKQGHSYIDFAKPSWPSQPMEVALNAKTGLESYMMGDLVKVASDTRAFNLEISLKSARGLSARLHKSANLDIPTELGLIDQDHFTRLMPLKPPKGQSWVFLEVLNAEGKLMLLTNPIYFENTQ
jgi:hypothetical protein